MNTNYRKIFIISVLIICIVAINMAVFSQITKKPKKSKDEKKTVDTTKLVEEFEAIFNNKIDIQENKIQVQKIDSNKELVYTSYLKKENENGLYDFDINIPYINIDNANAKNINSEIENVFYKKISNIQSLGQTAIYSVKYQAYVNDNILSIIISSKLKEGSNSQRVIIKTYNYNLLSNKVCTLPELLSYKGLQKQDTQDKINETIQKSINDVNQYKALGYERYLRNINDSMYKIENTTTFFLGSNKTFYIIYPYGNSNYTSEFDLIVL